MGAAPGVSIEVPTVGCMRSPRRLSASVAALALLLVVAACGDDDGGDVDAVTTSSTTEAPTESSGPTTDETPDSTQDDSDGSDTSATDGDDGDGSTGAPTTGDLPGEVVELYPYEGATQSVVGVEAGDTLNVRSGPGTDFGVVVELDPRSAEAVATGHNRVLDDGTTWAELTVGDDTGWANVAYLAEAGETRDITDEVRVSPEGSSPADIAVDVAGQRSPEEPTPRLTVVHESQGLGVVDLLGIGDDAAKGERITVTVEAGTVTVESTVLCARGVSGGLCV